MVARKRNRMRSSIMQKIVTDVTYIKHNGKWYYLAGYLDLFNNEIMEWELSDTFDNFLVMRPAERLLKRKMSTEHQVLLHSDQGVQYSSAGYCNLLKKYNVIQSMSRAGTPHDNAVMESFWGRFKDTLHKHFRYWESDDLRSTIEQAIYYAKRDIWTAETLFQALHLCDDPRLALALNVSFCCSLRIGEMLGLTWDCVDISEDSIESGTASVYVNKELQRVSRKTLSALDGKDVMLEFPATTSVTSTVLVLKSPKTESSVRKVFLPKAVAHMLAEWKQTQDEKIELLGSEYQDFNLVFAGALGLPTEASTINAALRRLIKENDLPPVVFHSFRHASITYKLKLNGGDIKAVQGDSGHSQVKMVTDVYSHILDDDRKNNAQLFQEAFYDKKDTKQPTPSFSLPEGISPETLEKMLASPEIAALLGVLAKNM